MSARWSNHRLWHLGSPLQWAIWDALVAMGSMLLAFRLAPASKMIALVETHIRALPAAGIFATSSLLVSYALGSAYYTRFRSRSRVVLLILMLTLVALGLTSLVISFAIYKQIGRHIIGICALLFFGIEASVRLFWLGRITAASHHIIICSDAVYAEELCGLLKKATFPFDIVAIFGSEETDISRLQSALAAQSVHEIVVHDIPGSLKSQLLAPIDRGVAVSSMDAFAERHFLKIPCTFISPDWFFQIDFKQHHPFYHSTKRLLDILLALLGGLLAAPLLLVAILAIKLESRGPVMYTQIRVGQFQRPFIIWKLRTMRVGSECGGAQWAKTRDPRVTRIGRVLRKSRIDEIPQFWNILRGDMALIGPRPERPEFVDRLTQTIPFYRQRHLLKPGLTGWAQICYRYGSSEADAREKLSYDLYYLKNASLLLDLQILLQTIGAVARGSR